MRKPFVKATKPQHQWRFYFDESHSRLERRAIHDHIQYCLDHNDITPAVTSISTKATQITFKSGRDLELFDAHFNHLEPIIMEFIHFETERDFTKDDMIELRDELANIAADNGMDRLVSFSVDMRERIIWMHADNADIALTFEAIYGIIESIPELVAIPGAQHPLPHQSRLQP